MSISIQKYKNCKALLRSLEKNKIRLMKTKSNVSYITEKDEFCLSHMSFVRAQCESAFEEIIRSGESIRKFVCQWAKETASGDKAYSVKDIVDSLSTLDSDRILTVKEMILSRNILITEAAEAYCRLAENAAEEERQREKAEKWIDRQDEKLPANAVSPIFYEYALKLASEREASGIREILLKRLSLMGIDEEECIRIFAKEQSESLLKLKNIIGLLYTVKNADWDQVFRKASFTERKLAEDPSGIYGMQDEESKAHVRNALEKLCLRHGISERAAASAVIELVKDGAINNVPEGFFTDDGRRLMLSKLNADYGTEDKTVIDRNGKILILSHAGLSVVALMLIFILISPFAALISLPAVWVSARHIINRLIRKFVPVHPVLRLEMKFIPDDVKTIVMVPALIPGCDRAEEILANLEAYGVHSQSENMDFLLLADFKDSETEKQEQDEAIKSTIKRIINAMNKRAGRRKYFYLHRKRMYNKNDGIWMGRERKRGAIEDFNLLALGYENRFTSEGADAEFLKNKYTYAVTLDADTQLISGTLEKMIGAIHHPINKRYNVIQPRMETDAGSCESRLAEFLSRSAGSDIYNACAQDPYQDFTGKGLFSGKGIYRIKEFFESTHEVFDENTVLSHDMIEGVLAGCGYCGDVVLFEGFPQKYASFLKRLERWTRGDWQLMRYAFGKIKLKAIDRYKIFDNVIRSLADFSFAAMIVSSAWSGEIAYGFAFLILFLIPHLSLSPDFKYVFAKLSMLPDTAKTTFTAAVRALYRMFVSHKHMLSWVTADESDKDNGAISHAGTVYSLLLLPAVFSPACALFCAALGFIFVCGNRYLRTEDKNEDPPFTLSDYSLLIETAEKTWKYFTAAVKPGSETLPPDNIQLDPPKGAAITTSPTNIAMYISSVISAHILDLIDESEMRARLNEIGKTVKKLKKWHGLTYNWYDVQTLEPMKPKYVSSVDCGNLMAACVLARNMTKDTDREISKLYESLVSEMDMRRLYDENKKLFRIGFDEDRNVYSESYYDLMASEARILSYVSMAEKGIEPAHWMKLSRPVERVGRECVLMSWSGTAFEYLMPFLFLPSAKGTLLNKSARGIISLQEKHKENGLWGISESGYVSFDAQLNYQYKAFGIPEAALSGESEGRVIAPYACALGLPLSPVNAIKNLHGLKEKGFTGEYGFYEAIDFSVNDSGNTVFSYMSHHQGMILCAIANALTDNGLQRIFMKDPRERAFVPLLNEKPFRVSVWNGIKSRINDEKDLESRADSVFTKRSYQRSFDSGKEDAHMLFSGEAVAYINESGAGFYQRKGIYANLWRQYSERYEDRMIPDVRACGEKMHICGGEFSPGIAEFIIRNRIAKGKLSIVVSPENGSLIYEITVENKTSERIAIEVSHTVKLALCDEESIFAHPVFNDLFIKRLESEKNENVFRKVKRNDEESEIDFIHGMYGFEKVMKEYSHPKLGLKSALKGETVVDPFESKNAYVRMHLFDCKEAAKGQDLEKETFERTKLLASSYHRTLITYYGLTPQEYRHTDMCARKIQEIRLPDRKGEFREDTLWPLGISGKKPILLSMVKDDSSLPAMKKLLSVHEYLKNAGIRISMAIVHPDEIEYFTPMKDKIESILLSGCVSESCNKEEGVFLLNEKSLAKAQAEYLEAVAVMKVKKDFLKDTLPVRNSVKAADSMIPLEMHVSNRSERLISPNGFGGFDKKTRGYIINLSAGNTPPAAWANLLAEGDFGAILTDRGIGSIWHGNSRNGRITPYDNDPEDKYPTVKLEAIVNEKKVNLTPGCKPRFAYRVTHSPYKTAYEIQGDDIGFRSAFYAAKGINSLIARIDTQSHTEKNMEVTIKAIPDFLMGTDVRDKRFLFVSSENGVLIAKGRMDGVGYAGFKDGECKDKEVFTRFVLGAGKEKTVFFMIGWAQDSYKAKRIYTDAAVQAEISKTVSEGSRYLSQIDFDTGNEARDILMNGFVKYQTLASRIHARCGMYQPGGAVGFRDQLQDMLSVMYFDPGKAKEHILLCASRQFIEGDAMHWWHSPARGVRTKISDDVLFLAYVTAKYISVTGDREILGISIPYLESVPIPEGKEDIYFEGRASEIEESLYLHIIRAFKKVSRTGDHNLLLMGSGDWNDGMNRIGCLGKGESVWLSEFMIVCAREFMPYAKDKDKPYFENIIKTLKSSIEENGWDGKWYLRAYNDFGEKIGSNENKECRIDLISQAWAVLAELDGKRTEIALESVKELLTDEECSLIKLLAPPFHGIERDPGYISKYPSGVRENGGQYTHAVCWYVKALAKAGYADEAWKAFDMLLPILRTDTKKKAENYLSEPYVIAADISYGGEWCGVGGWTWYTGAASWAFCVLLEDLMGFSMRGNKASFSPLLSENMEKASVTIRRGSTSYFLIGDRNARETQTETEIVMDGKEHRIQFPVRNGTRYDIENSK